MSKFEIVRDLPMGTIVRRSNKLKRSDACLRRRSYQDVFAEDSTNRTYNKSVFIKNAIINRFIARELAGKDDEVVRIYRDYVAGEELPTSREEAHMARIIRDCVNSLDKPVDNPEDVPGMIARFLDDDFIEEFLADRFATLEFYTEKTREIQTKQASAWVLRYLHEEIRTPVLMGKAVVKIFEQYISVRPDLVFFEKDGTIEVVILRAGKPSVTQNGRKEDHSVRNCKELFALFCLGRALIKDNKAHLIKGSYYFLRRADDTDEEFDGHFFDYEEVIETVLPSGKVKTKTKKISGKNIVGIEDTLEKDSTSIWDESYQAQYDEYLAGKDLTCDPEACSDCGFARVCSYNKAPLVSEVEKKEKSLDDIDLSDKQEKIVFFRKGIARVNAVAGCGKTMVVTLRHAYMISEGIDPDKILLITFTDAGAREMRERIEGYCKDFGFKPEELALHCMTFNSFGNEIIKKEYERLGFSQVPRVIDDIERKAIIAEELNKHYIEGLDYKNFDMDMGSHLKGALAVVSEAFHIIKKDNLSIFSVDAFKIKMAQAGLTSYIKDDGAYRAMLEAYERFDDELRGKNLIEYADQERLIFDLLAMDPYYLDRLGFEHIIVDEFQDTSDNQMMLLQRLIECDSFQSLLVVGDDAQSIFSFRDATPENMINFFDIIGQEGTEFNLVENYRSTGAILEFANEVNKRNVNRIDKDLVPVREYGTKPVVKGFASKDKEYTYIAEEIKKLLADGKDPEDIAIIAATRAELLAIAGVMADHQIETSLAAPEPMLENSRILAIISLCDALQDSTATACILDVLCAKSNGDLFSNTPDELNALIKEYQEEIGKYYEMPLDQQVKWFAEQCAEICGNDSVAKSFVTRLDRFVTMEDKFIYAKRFVDFKGDKQKREGKFSGVVLTTAHSSKGLEWPVVFNTVTKYDNERLEMHEKEERRRLFFVSATRARDMLYVTGQYKIAGSKTAGYAYNTFLAEAFDILSDKDMFSVMQEEEKAEQEAKETSKKTAKTKPEK